MNSEIFIEIIKILPQFIELLILFTLVLLFYKPIKNELIPRIGRFKGFGVEVSFISEAIKEAGVRLGDNQPSINDRTVVARRAKRIAPLLQGSQVLWVDDIPSSIISELRILRSLGMFIDQVQTSKEALSMLSRIKYDVVISDIYREGNKDEGVRFLSKMRELGIYRWTIFYIRNFIEEKGVPPYAFGITNRPDHLLHLIFDVIERERS